MAWGSGLCGIWGSISGCWLKGQESPDHEQEMQSELEQALQSSSSVARNVPFAAKEGITLFVARNRFAAHFKGRFRFSKV